MFQRENEGAFFLWLAAGHSSGDWSLNDVCENGESGGDDVMQCFHGGIV